MELKQEALTFARDWGADYILFADTDNILTNNQTLRLLMGQGLPVVAPMLDSQTYYSNFWCGITPRATTAAQPSTSPPRTASAGAASASPWSTPPSWYPCGLKGQTSLPSTPTSQLHLAFR